MIAAFYFIVAIIGIAIHLLVRRRHLNATRTLEIILVWCFGVLVGLANVVSAGFHIFDAAMTARQIGWAPGSPFQFENAMGDFAFGILGLLSIRFHGLFWLATGIGFSISWLGDAYGHIYQYEVHHDTAPYNTGFLLASDIATPILILVLLVIYFVVSRDQRRSDHAAT